MKRKKLFTGLGVIALIIVALIAAFFILSMPEQPEPPASEKNTLLYEKLVSQGIEDAVIDVSERQVLVRYNLPPTLEKQDAVIIVANGSAAVAPETEKIIIQTYQNFEPVDEIVISTNDVISFAEGKMSKEEFLMKIS